MDESKDFMGLDSLQALISDGSASKLEQGVEVGLKILGDVKAAFANAKGVAEIAQWIKSSDRLRSQVGYERTVVGVVGSTGAGKSSVINAVLDEEGLVPTNCMRACTAVITELAYNSSDQQEERYRAEVHFITANEWANELRIVLEDIKTSPDVFSTDSASADSETSIAYDKIRSVYPFLKSDEIKKGKFVLEELIQHPSVKGLLGTVTRIASPSSEKFHSHLKQFIDSKEKTRGRKKEPEVMEYWPLVKVVKLFVRSPILKTGLVLVDLVSHKPRIRLQTETLTSCIARYPQLQCCSVCNCV
jgi:hypothetical protein